MSKLNIVPVFVPHYGCPNDCIFCNQRKITNKDYIDDLNKTRLDIEEYLAYFSNKNTKVQIAFYGGSFTGLDTEIMVKYLELANEFIISDKVNSIRLSTRPDYINSKVLDILKKYNVETIELGVQSLDEEVLRYNNRGHNTKVVYDASYLIKEYGFKLGLQQMVGLYKDDIYKDYFTAKEFVKIKPNFVRIYPTLVIKDTPLEKLYNDNLFNPLTLEESIDVIKPLYILYVLNNINIIRIGLQPTENINDGKDVIAGPFHPAYRQLLLQDIYKEIISKNLEEYMNIDNLIIYSSSNQMSYIVGNKGVNKAFFLNKLNIKNIKFKSIEENILILLVDGVKNTIDVKDYFMEYIKNFEG